MTAEIAKSLYYVSMTSSFEDKNVQSWGVLFFIHPAAFYSLEIFSYSTIVLLVL